MSKTLNGGNLTYGGHEKVHEYFRNNNMTSFIPIKYTYDKKTSIRSIRRDRIQNRLRSKKQKRDGSFSGDTT